MQPGGCSDAGFAYAALATEKKDSHAFIVTGEPNAPTVSRASLAPGRRLIPIVHIGHDHPFARRALLKHQLKLPVIGTRCVIAEFADNKSERAINLIGHGSQKKRASNALIQFFYCGSASNHRLARRQHKTIFSKQTG